MLILTSEYVQHFLTPDRKLSLKWLLLGVLVSLFLGIFCFMQTEQFVSLMPRPSDQEVRQHIESSKTIQAEVKKKANKPEPLENPEYLYFSKRQVELLDDARKFLLNDPELNEIVEKRFLGSLKDQQIVIAPFWETDNQGYSEVLGLTKDFGWSDFEEAYNDCHVGATTIREKPQTNHQKTLDGRPRIILKATAFESKRSIRLALFHEMLHAVNIPGYEYKPELPLIGKIKVTLTQTDLTYLAEYRLFARKADLYRWDDYILGLLTLVFVTAFVWTFVLFVKRLLLLN